MLDTLAVLLASCMIDMSDTSDVIDMSDRSDMPAAASTAAGMTSTRTATRQNASDVDFSM